MLINRSLTTTSRGRPWRSRQLPTHLRLTIPLTGLLMTNQRQERFDRLLMRWIYDYTSLLCLCGWGLYSDNSNSAQFQWWKWSSLFFNALVKVVWAKCTQGTETEIRWCKQQCVNNILMQRVHEVKLVWDTNYIWYKEMLLYTQKKSKQKSSYWCSHEFPPK